MIYQKKKTKKKQWDQGPLFVNYLEQIVFVLLRLGAISCLTAFGDLCSLQPTENAGCTDFVPRSSSPCPPPLMLIFLGPGVFGLQGSMESLIRMEGASKWTSIVFSFWNVPRLEAEGVCPPSRFHSKWTRTLDSASQDIGIPVSWALAPSAVEGSLRSLGACTGLQQKWRCSIWLHPTRGM